MKTFAKPTIYNHRNLPFGSEPQSELDKNLNGDKTVYYHLLFCNADHSKPLGGSMCICLNVFSKIRQEENVDNI